jgi:hypothetical protein
MMSEVLTVSADVLERIRKIMREDALTLGECEEVIACQCEMTGRLLSALLLARSVAEEARVEWDEAPAGMKAGKLLIALSGALPGYRADIDEIHNAIASAMSAGTAETQSGSGLQPASAAREAGDAR